ncbi:MAG: calcium-binding protein, partial [Methylophilus sp.]
MTTMQQYFDYSQLSLTAYTENLQDGALSATNSTFLTEAGLAQAQIDQLIASGWEVVDQSKDSLYGDSSFSATLFHNTQTDEYVFANRGTADSTDYIADIWGIATLGLASSQVIDMYRYYKQLITPAGQSVNYSSQELEVLYEIGKYYAPLSYSGVAQIYNLISSDQGLGKLSENQIFTTTGHSLGGHLSLWLNALVSQNVDHVYTYNGAGQGNLLLSAITFINGIITGEPLTRTADSDVTNIYGYGGPAIIAGVGGSVGQNYPINIEYKGPADGLDYYKLYNHSIVQLTDSIAVANVLATLDNSIPTSQFNSIFDKSSNEVGTSLEGVLDGLRKYFGMTDTTPNDNRDQFYENLTDLQNSAVFQSLSGKVTIEAVPTSASEARNDFSAFLSLFYLTPFMLKTSSAEANNLLLAANQVLGDKWTDDYNLSNEDLQNGKANFSDMWLADRAVMLSWVNKINKNDIQTDRLHPYENITPLGLTDTQPQHFQDMQSGVDIFLGPEERRHFIFGSNDDDIGDAAITGGSKNDHLYGMDGNDTINGGNGNDYIEGNAGQDTLNGDNGNDTLIGGDDVDILDGGEGNDQLKGGEGVDVYQFSGTYGTDIITDSDGQGFVTINDTPANSGTFKLDNIYKNDSTGYTFTKVNGGTSIVISKEDDPNRIIINNWSETNNLSINLTGSAQAPTGNEMNGDFTKKINDNGTPGNTSDDYYEIDTVTNNYIVDPDNPVQANAADLLNGRAGADAIYGKGGSDAILGFGGDDYIDGGNGGDVLQGGLGKDTILGGDGHDVIYGSSNGSLTLPTDANFTQANIEFDVIRGIGFNWISGYDLVDSYGNGTPSGSLSDTVQRDRQAGDAGNLIDGGIGDDFIAAGTGADYVHGGEDKDLIWGMDGSDILFGDAGNDVVFGDGLLTKTGNVVWTELVDHGHDIIDGGDGEDYLLGQGGNDIIYGGANDDRLWGDDPLYHTDATGDDFLYGGTGNDQLAGGNGNDYLDGGDENDMLFGEADDDYLNGGDGNDELHGGAGNDILIGGAGKDVFVGDAGADTIFLNLKEGDTLGDAGDSADTVILDVVQNDVGVNYTPSTSGPTSVAITLNSLSLGGSGSEITNGLVGDSDYTYTFADGTQMLHSDLLGNRLHTAVTLYASTQAVFGGAEADTLFAVGGVEATVYAGLGDDTLSGYIGNQTLIGGGGADTYFFEIGSDIDTIRDTNAEANTLSFGEFIYSADIKLKIQSTTLVLDFGFGDQVLIENFNQNDVIGSSVIGNFEFYSGLTLDVNQFFARGFDLDGTTGNDTIVGTNITDRINGLGGVDQLSGGYGNDVIHGGLGNDVIYGDFLNVNQNDGYDELYGDEGNDTLVGGGGADIMYGGLGDDLYLVENVSDEVRENLNEGTDTVQANISYTLANDVENLTLLGSDNLDATGNALDNDLVGNSADNTLTGGLGNDVLVGGLGNDVYHFNLGDGEDIIVDTDGINTISFGTNINLADIELTQYQGDDGNYYLRVKYGSLGDSVVIKHGLTGNIQNYQFADGNSISYADLIGTSDVPFEVYGTTDSDSSLYGSNYDDIIYADTGNDQLFGMGGNDVLNGEDGDDTLEGGVGDDTLIGGFGSDTLAGGDGNDWLEGGAGDDTLVGGAGDDGYFISWGMGKDTILDGTDGELNEIQLDEGITLADLSAKRIGDDLSIHFRSSDDGVLIKDYYLSNQQWNLYDDNSNETALSDFVNASNSETELDSLFSNYLTDVKSNYFKTLANNGWSVEGQSAFTSRSEKSPSRHIYYDYSNHLIQEIQYSDDAVITRQSSANLMNTSLLYRDVRETAFWSSGVRQGAGSSFSSMGSGSSSPYFVSFSRGASRVLYPLGSGVMYTSEGYWVYPPETAQPSNILTTVVTFTKEAYRVNTTSTIESISAGDSDNEIHINHKINSSDTVFTKALDVGLTVDAGGGDDIINPDEDYLGWNTLLDNGYRTNYIGALLYGNTGNDYINGTKGNDILVGGNDSDYIDGHLGGDTYFISFDDDGIDTIDDTGYLTVPYEGPGTGYDNFYYKSIGLTNWEDLAWSHQLPALPEIGAMEYDKLQPLYDAGILEMDTVEFGQGINLSDLTVTKNSDGTLNIRWGTDKGIDIKLPIIEPHEESSWGADSPSQAWHLGQGIERFKFADGTILSMQEMLDMVIEETHFMYGTENTDYFYAENGDFTMIGYGSQDGYYVDSLGDRVIEEVGGGYDWVESSIT